MKMHILAASLISAGLASLVTAKVVENKMNKEIDERVAREVSASVEFLEKIGVAKPTDEYQEKHKQVFGTRFEESDDPRVGTNEKVRYDKIVKGYVSSTDVVTADDGTMMMAEVQHEGGVEACDTLPDIHAITTDEFMANESGFLQSSLTYFADGGVLDEDGDLVVDHVDLIGDAIPPFGQLSGESHVVYLRNTKKQLEFEVIQDDANAADIISPGEMT